MSPTNPRIERTTNSRRILPVRPTYAAFPKAHKTMIEPNTPASVRVRAAECVLNHAMKAIEIEDIEARVSELERAAEASKSDRTR